MMILEKIINDNLAGLQERKNALPLAQLKKIALSQVSPRVDLEASLKGKGIKLIAEVKKASPSKGVIRADFNPVEIARIYAENGAAAISVITEHKNFQGNLEYLKKIRDGLEGNRPPILRKDFIHDPYQVYESRLYGADSLLLIAAILTPEKLAELLKLSHRLGLKCLVEVHNEIELDMALQSEAHIIGINNRDLKTFEIDLAVTERLRPLIPPDRVVVSESGIKNRGDIIKLEKLGVNAALIGEALMSAPDIALKMKELL